MSQAAEREAIEALLGRVHELAEDFESTGEYPPVSDEEAARVLERAGRRTPPSGLPRTAGAARPK